MHNYFATQQKFTEGQYTCFTLMQYAPGRKDPMKLAKHVGETVDDALLVLKREVDKLPPGTKFEIAAKRNKTDNDSAADVWQFTNADLQPQQQNPFHQMQPNFGGFGAINPMYDPNEIKEERRRLDERKEALTKGEIQLILDRNNLIRDKESHERQVKQDQERLGELEKKYSSTANAAARGFELVLTEAFENFGQDGNFGRFGAKLMGLPAPNTLGSPESEEESTEEDKVLEKLATDLSNLGLTLEQYTEIYGMVMHTVKKKGWLKGGNNG